MKNYLFAKFFQSMTARELAEYCISVGLDGPTLLIRDGYWVTPENVRQTLPAFVRTVTDAGAEVTYADTSYDLDRLDQYDDILALMRDNGVKMFRTNHVAKMQQPARALHDRLCRGMEIAEKTARKHGLRAVVQIHGFLYPHNATAAYFACKNFDPEYIGIKLDPGNNIAQEGHEDFAYQVDLLREYIAAVGEKDARLICDGQPTTPNKGWRREFVPADRGVNNYRYLFDELKKHNICVPGILMPFYHEKNLDALKADFAAEVAYFKRCQAESGL